MTTREPGASEVFTHGLGASPRSAAFFASSAAPIITSGLEVLVQEVIAAITTAPCSSSASCPPSSITRTGRRGLVAVPVAGDRDRVGGGKRLGTAFIQPDRRRPGCGVPAQHRAERLRRLRQRDAVLRALRAGDPDRK